MSEILETKKPARPAGQGLDLSALKNRRIATISSEEALKDVIPIDWGEDVLSGKVKVLLIDKTDD